MAESHNATWQWESEEELRMLEDLRQQMGLENTAEVVRALVRQACYRAQILCPRCGSAAEKTGEDRAQCQECLSSLRLAEGMTVVLEQRGQSAA